jgi:hypothetical protein
MSLLLLIIVLFLIFGGGGYWVGGDRGPYYGGIGIGGVLLILLILYAIGFFGRGGP